MAESSLNFDPDKTTASYDLADPVSLKGSPIKVYFYGDSKSDQKPNFIWGTYEVIFKKLFYGKDKEYLDGIHYTYSCNLDDSGKRKGPGSVVITDKSTDKEVSDKFRMSGEEAERDVIINGKKFLEKIELIPHGLSDKDVSYNNTWEFATKKSMTLEEFKREFSKDIYVAKDGNNPVNNLLHKPTVKTEPQKEVLKMGQDEFHLMVVKVAKENYKGAEAETGGFDILQKWQKKQVEKQKEKNK